MANWWAIALLGVAACATVEPSGKRSRMEAVGVDSAGYIKRFRTYIGAEWWPTAMRWRREPRAGALEVTVGIAVKANGDLDDVRVMTPSGNDMLDNAALRVVRNAAPFSAPPKAMLADGSVFLPIALGVPELGLTLASLRIAPEVDPREFLTTIARQVHNRWLTLASREHATGTFMQVRATFTIDGSVEEIVVVRSSGSIGFDMAGVRAFSELAPLENPPDALFDEQGRLTVVFDFDFGSGKDGGESGQAFVRRVDDDAARGFVGVPAVREILQRRKDARPRMVVIGLVLDRFGVVRYARVTRSSGIEELDRAALRALANNGPYESPPPGLLDEHQTFRFERGLIF